MCLIAKLMGTQRKHTKGCICDTFFTDNLTRFETNDFQHNANVRSFPFWYSIRYKDAKNRTKNYEIRMVL